MNSDDMRNPKNEFEKLMERLGETEKMGSDERATFFAFFCYGFYARTGEAFYQGEFKNETK